MTSLIIHADELVLITTISSSQKRFIINQGRNHGIVPNQTRAFSTDKLSLMCYAIESSPDYSLWEINDSNALVPFRKNQLVLIHTSLMDARTRTYLRQERQKIKRLRESGDLLFEDFDYEAKQMGLYHLAKRPNWIIRGGSGVTVYDSLSSADADQKTSKSQINFEGLYSKRVLAHRYDWGIGIRWDQEAEELKDQEIVVPIRRFLFITEFSYHLDKWKGGLSNFYFSAGTGVGKTSAEIDEYKLEGTSFLFPYLKVGILGHIKSRLYLITELSVENLITNMRVKETGKKQTSSNINTKFSVGIRF